MTTGQKVKAWQFNVCVDVCVTEQDQVYKEVTHISDNH